MIKSDHYIIAVENLENAVAEFEQRSGVRPRLSGQHRSLGTHNALVSLGDDVYLEFLAIDPSLQVESNAILARLRKLKSFSFFGWALQYSDFSELREAATGAGLTMATPASGSRVTPEGSRIQYEFTEVEEAEQDFDFPFFVRWINTVHPSRTAPGGCEFDYVEVPAFRPSAKQNFLEGLRLTGVRGGEVSCPRLHLRTPHGKIVFSFNP